MSLDGNLKWLFEQPLAFWLTAIVLGVGANFFTHMIYAGFSKSTSRYKVSIISQHLVAMNRIEPYIRANKGLERVLLSYMHTILSIILMTNTIIFSLIFAISNKFPQEIDNNIYLYIIRIMIFIATILSVYVSFSSFKNTYLSKSFYEEICIKRNIDLSSEVIVRMILRYTRSSRQEVLEVWQHYDHKLKNLRKYRTQAA